ncbi:hypothetical protein B5K05_13190 [Rhizobium phaseoli]|uniref:hypothetical protein n=1 Tax=Rhizobium phaseoli TaxID=396 RepID=UPI000E0CE767|nr:hypothetical protein [Rhizobium phaseoli]RDJ10084.1 hypothetical protein B5K04_13165 [Rhizobium phaseoli]RDJ14084.1 hypothetical protein B5K05_13190 [Rhizobium phaseoli]
MNIDAIDLFDDLLSSGIISTDRHRAVVDAILDQQEFSAQQVVSFALYQSISDVIRVAGSHGFDEEHVTASLTGSLASNLGWFAKSYRRIGGAETLPALQWVHQTKRSEARSGIDFGILARIPGGDVEKAYRLIVIQAKLGDPKDLTIAIDHETNPEPGNSKPPLSKDASKIFKVAAGLKAQASVDEQLMNDAIEIAHKGFESGDARYQLEAILRTDLRGRALAPSKRDWCFYAGWFPTRLPRAVDVRTLAAATIAKGDNARPSQFSLAANAIAFADLFHETIYETDTPYGLELSEEQVGKAVNGIFEAAPEIRLLLASADGRLDYDLGPTKRLLVSGSLIPKRLITPQFAPRPDNSVVMSDQHTSDNSSSTTLGR